MPFMNRLQQWYLARTQPSRPQTTDDYGVIGNGTLRFIATDHKNEFADEFPGADVLVSTHDNSCVVALFERR